MFIEMDPVRKDLLYFAVSAVVGLLVILIPIFAFAAIGYADDLPRAELFSRGLRGLEGAQPLTAPRSPISDLEVLIVSFAIALFVYFLTRRRLSSRHYEWRRMVPY